MLRCRSALVARALIAAFAAGLIAGCHGSSSVTAPPGVGPTNEFSAYGRNPPPPDAPPSAWPSPDAGVAVGGSAGCAHPLGEGTQVRTVEVDGKKRTYVLVVPKNHAGNAPLPLVIGLHGDSGNGESARRSFSPLEQATEGRAVLAFPSGTGGWDLDTATEKNEDVHFFDTLLFDVANATCLDLRRVLVTGFSRGAYMANQLACRRGDRIRAIVAHGGGGPYELAGRYDAHGNLVCNSRSVAALVVHGQDDRVVDPSESEKSLAHHRAANRCSAGAHKGPMPGCITYDGCAQPVARCVLPNLGHALSPDALRASWSFFQAVR